MKIGELSTKGKFIRILSIVVMLCYLIYIEYEDISISIPGFGIWLKSTRFMMITYIGTFVWYLLPIKKYFRKGNIHEFFYNLFPVFISALLLFAQYYELSAFLLICFIFMTIATSVIIYIYYYTGNKRKNKIRRIGLIRADVFIISLVLTIPTVGVLISDKSSPAYTANILVLFEDSELINENYELDMMIENNDEVLSDLSKDKWEKLDELERISTLKVVSDITAKYLGVACIEVESISLPTGILGQYNDDNNKISINRNVLFVLPAEDLVKTILHETFHGYQHFIVEKTGVKAEDCIDIPGNYFGDIRRWKNEQQNYTSNIMEGYYTQAVEVSARVFEDEQIVHYEKYLK